MKNLSNEFVIQKNENGMQFLQFKKLLEYSDIINHAYSLNIDIDYKAKDQDSINKNLINYQNLCNAINCDYNNIVKPDQQHTDQVKTIEGKINPLAPDINKYLNTDGLITNQSNLILATTNADCILMLFFDPVKRVISNIHSGWKGTLQRISVKTITKMQETYNCNPKDIICCMCPSIRKCHFEVDSDVAQMFMNEFTDINGYIKETINNKKWHIDTILINRLILENSGLRPENIIDSDICSVCNSDIIHSYRVEGENYGLATALIEIK